jgi:predicted molibdopterin-dependent oxidoreductase YjgC
LVDFSVKEARVKRTRQRRLSGAVSRGQLVNISVDGQAVAAYEGESVAAALSASDVRTLRTSPRRGEPRGTYCGIGLCFDCVVTVDGRPNTRACQTVVREGLRVERQAGKGTWPTAKLSGVTP